MAKVIGKARKLKREGHFGSGNFKEVAIEGLEEVEVAGKSPQLGAHIELDRVLCLFPGAERRPKVPRCHLRSADLRFENTE
jgi:hypothetical protein